MKKILINDVEHSVDERFVDYTFVKKPSSNVYCFGYTTNDIDTPNNIVVQFNNGGTYLYVDVGQRTIRNAMTCESIGKYYRAEISGKHTGVKLQGQAVTKVKEAQP